MGGSFGRLEKRSLKQRRVLSATVNFESTHYITLSVISLNPSLFCLLTKELEYTVWWWDHRRIQQSWVCISIHYLSLIFLVCIWIVKMLWLKGHCPDLILCLFSSSSSDTPFPGSEDSLCSRLNDSPDSDTCTGKYCGLYLQSVLMTEVIRMSWRIVILVWDVVFWP